MRTIVQSEAFEASSAYLLGGQIEADEWLREVECELTQELNFAAECYPPAGMAAGLLRRTMITPSRGMRGALVVSFSVEPNNTHIILHDVLPVPIAGTTRKARSAATERAAALNFRSGIQTKIPDRVAFFRGRKVSRFPSTRPIPSTVRSPSVTLRVLYL